MVIWNKNVIPLPQSIVFFLKLGKIGWGFSKVTLHFFMWNLDIVSVSQPWWWHYVCQPLFVSSWDLFFSFDSLSHLDKILKSPKIRCWRSEAGNSWRKWNESILHLYSSVEQVRFGINLNSNDAYHSCSTLYFQNSFQTLISLSEYHFGGLSKHSHFISVGIYQNSQFIWVI